MACWHELGMPPACCRNCTRPAPGWRAASRGGRRHGIQQRARRSTSAAVTRSCPPSRPAPAERAAPVVVAGTTAPVQVAVNTADLPCPVARLPASGQRACDRRQVDAGSQCGPDRRHSSASPGPRGSVRRAARGRAAAARLRAIRHGPRRADHPRGQSLLQPAGMGPFAAAHRHRAARAAPGFDVFRACLRAICYAVKSVLGTLTEHAGIPALPVVATGGMSRNAEWAQLLADATGREVRVRSLPAIGGRAGASLVAGGVPGWRSGGSPGEPSTPAEERCFGPRAAAAPDHDAGSERYQQLYQAAQLELSAAGE